MNIRKLLAEMSKPENNLILVTMKGWDEPLTKDEQEVKVTVEKTSNKEGHGAADEGNINSLNILIQI